ncbi:MAG: MFS transporter [Nitriliruptoraceae bacterium]
MAQRNPFFGGPTPPRKSTRFSGWRIVVLAAVALGLTGPGQTPGISVFVDPMMAALDLTRSEFAIAYLFATLSGAVALPFVGRLIDLRGTRSAMLFVVIAFGFVVAAMAGVTGAITLVIGFTGIRMFGQGALQLVASTSVASWFDRRRGTAVGVMNAVGSSVMSLLPLLSSFAILWAGWRGAWLLLAGMIWLVLLPITMRGIIDRPSDVGQQPDGDPAPTDGDPVRIPQRSFTRREALRTPMFWAVAGAVGATAMIGTGLSFHQIDLLGEQGLTPVQAAANFLPQTLAALIVTLLVGPLIDRVAPRWVLSGSMAMIATAMIAVPFVTPGLTAALYGMAIGAAGSSARTLEAAVFPRLFGLGHIGGIRGVVSAIGVASSAFGPLALSLGYDATNSYVQVLLIMLVIPVVVAIAGLIAPDPRTAKPSSNE